MSSLLHSPQKIYARQIDVPLDIVWTIRNSDAVLLFAYLKNQHTYFAENHMRKDGEWFFQSYEDLHELFSWGETYQTKLFKILVDAALIEMQRKGVPARRHIRICKHTLNRIRKETGEQYLHMMEARKEEAKQHSENQQNAQDGGVHPCGRSSVGPSIAGVYTPVARGCILTNCNTVTTVKPIKDTSYLCQTASDHLALLWWNKLSAKYGLSKIAKITPKRSKGVAARLREGFTIEAAETAIAASSFCQGKNNRQWRVDFDWLFLSPNNWIKLLEGKYTDPTNKTQDGSGNSDGMGCLKLDDLPEKWRQRTKSQFLGYWKLYNRAGLTTASKAEFWKWYLETSQRNWTLLARLDELHPKWSSFVRTWGLMWNLDAIHDWMVAQDWIQNKEATKLLPGCKMVEQYLVWYLRGLYGHDDLDWTRGYNYFGVDKQGRCI